MLCIVAFLIFLLRNSSARPPPAGAIGSRRTYVILLSGFIEILLRKVPTLVSGMCSTLGVMVLLKLIVSVKKDLLFGTATHTGASWALKQLQELPIPTAGKRGLVRSGDSISLNVSKIYLEIIRPPSFHILGLSVRTRSST